jgi:GTP-binding protein Era
MLFVVDAMKWTPDDDLVLEKLEYTDTPVLLVLIKLIPLMIKTRYYRILKN